MKRLILMACALMTGCASTAPLYSFSPFTTADGQEKWRMASRNFDESAIQELIASGVGKHHMCPNGWEITNRSTSNNFEMIEGQCKK